MNHLHSLVLAITLLVGGMSVATAQDYDKGLEAYNAGDYQTALQEWLPPAEQGDKQAQALLGMMYGEGPDNIKDYVKAIKWYRLAAEQGYVETQVLLGIIYYEGPDNIKDDVEALKWYRIAAKQGQAEAQSRLGHMYIIGAGIPQNYIMGHMWSNIAAANEDERAVVWRGTVEKRMSQTDISKAQEMASECISSNYQNCGE